jgi:hypothetical protein
MSNNQIPWPPPASIEAQKKGCNCPIELNNFGVGIANGLGVDYMCSTDCPLHGKVAKAKENLNGG